MEELLNFLNGFLMQNVWIGLVVSFLAGVITSCMPCSLCNIPLIIGYVGGYSDSKSKALRYSLIFCIGQALTYTMLGLVAAFVGRLFVGIQTYWYIFLGILLVLMSLQTWEVINVFPQNRLNQYIRKKGVLGALLLGMVGAIASTPCSTPVLVGITSIASSYGKLFLGGAMLMLYSLGHGVVVLVAGSSAGFVNELVKKEGFGKIGKTIKIVMGILLLMLAVYFMVLAFI